MIGRLAALAGLLLMLAACGGGEQQEEEGTSLTDVAESVVEDAQEQPDADDGPVAAPAPAEGNASEDQALCELFDQDEVSALFEGQIELAEQRGFGVSSCAWSVVGAEGEGLILSTIPVGWVDQRVAAFEANDTADVERPALGVDAILINGSDLGIKVDGQTEYRVGLSAQFLSEDLGGEGVDPPEPEVVRTAVLRLGELLLERVS